MSALDKAFIKAYTRGAAGDGPPESPTAEAPPEAGVQALDTVVAPVGQRTKPVSESRYHRIDGGHGGDIPPPLSFALPASAADLEMAGMQGVLSDASDLSDLSDLSERSERSDASDLRLPSLFGPPEPAQPKRFTPDWEVDRFVWPPTCRRLLESENHYFQHVGGRLRAATDTAHHLVMIAGCRRGEGRTTLAMCLARAAAQAGVSVALVDAHLQNPQLGNRLGVDPPCGWLEVVEGTTALGEAAVKSLEDDLTLFPLTRAGRADVPLGDPRVLHLLRTIARHYRLVVVDTGPLESHDHPLLAAGDGSSIDAAILVRDVRHTTEQEARAKAQQLQRAGIAAVGIAENFQAR